MDVRLSPLDGASVEAAGALLAARHERERARFPLLSNAPADARQGAQTVTAMLEFCEGVVATLDGEPVGFLLAFEQQPDPASPIARYAPERALVSLVHCHAVAAGVDPYPVYAAMFAAVAERAVDAGIVDFVSHVPLADPATEAAWVALGFGRSNAVAMRDLAPLLQPGDVPGDVAVRIAGLDDLDVVERLVDEEAVFHARAPILRPYRRDETADAVRAQIHAEIASADHDFVIARHHGEDVGVLSIAPGLGYVRDRAIYIGATAVLPDARRAGVATALTDAALSWARDRGFELVSLHFSTANATSSAFWQRVGFVPVMCHMRRRLDERILTHRA